MRTIIRMFVIVFVLWYFGFININWYRVKAVFDSSVYLVQHFNPPPQNLESYHEH